MPENRNPGTSIRAIIGLGNPGAEYADTRHNAGFRFLDMLTSADNISLRRESRFVAHVAKTTIAGNAVWLCAPGTFMNGSGEAVAKLAHYHRLTPEALLVVHDELDLAVGTVRLKVGGGAGGHNGLSDIIQKLGTNSFVRLRIGIGRPATSAQVISYVLKRAPSAEQALIDDAMRQALQVLPEVILGDLPKAMNKLHTLLK